MKIANLLVLATLFGLCNVEAVQLNNKLRMKNKSQTQTADRPHTQLMQTNSKMRMPPNMMGQDPMAPGG